MASEPNSHLARKKYFHCFDIEALQNSSEEREEIDLKIGPYGLTYLSASRIHEFKLLLNEFETLFREHVSGYKELRAQLNADRSLVTAKKIFHSELFQNSKTICSYVETGLKLASEKFWKTLVFSETDKAKIEHLRIKWLLHAEWAYLTSPQLIRAKGLLQRIRDYAQEAEKELKSTERKRKLDPRNIAEITIPIIRNSSNQSSIKNPFYVSTQFTQFSEKYQIYITSLQSQVTRLNKSLAEAMLARLEYASESDVLQNDDVLYDCVKKIEKLVDEESFKKIGFTEVRPRKTLNKEAYQIFPMHIIEFGNDMYMSGARLKKLKWMQMEDGIPFQFAKDVESQLCMTATNVSSTVNIPSYVNPYDLALFNITMHNIQAWDKDIFHGTVPLEFWQLDFRTLRPLFTEVFVFIKLEYEQLNTRSTERNDHWDRLLRAKTIQVLGFSKNFMTFMRTSEKNLNLNINTDYTYLLCIIRDFCDFIAENTGDPSNESLKKFEDTRQPLINEFFNLLTTQKIADRDMLQNCLYLLSSCLTAAQRNHVEVMRKLLFNEDISSITVQEIRKALESPAFNLPKEKIYDATKLLLETAYHLRDKKLSPCLVRLFNDFDKEYGTSLVMLLTQDDQVRVKAAISLVENVNFQATEVPYVDILDALTVLSSLSFFDSHKRILHNCIKRYLEHYKGQDFKALEMVLLVNSEDQIKIYAQARLQVILSTDPALIANDETRHGFKRLFQCSPFLPDYLGVFVTPWIDRFIECIPGKIVEYIDVPVPPFRVNGLTMEMAFEIVDFFLPSKKEMYCESIERAFYDYFEALINPKVTVNSPRTPNILANCALKSDSSSIPVVKELASIKSRAVSFESETQKYYLSRSLKNFSSREATHQSQADTIPLYDQRVGKFTDKEIVRYLYMNSVASILDSKVQQINEVAEYLWEQGFELRGAECDGSCFFHAFLKSYTTLSRKIPLIEENQHKISYLRTLVANRYRKSKGEAGKARADQIEKDTHWVTASDEGDLLADALKIPIRVVTVKQDDDHNEIVDMVKFPDSGKEPRLWTSLEESEKRQEYIFIVDVGHHYICAQPSASLALKDSVSMPAVEELASIKNRPLSLESGIEKYSSSKGTRYLNSRGPIHEFRDDTIPSYDQRVGRFTDEEIGRYLYINPFASIDEVKVQRINEVALYLWDQGFELRGAKGDGNCFFHAFLQSYKTLSKKMAFLDEQKNPISYLRTLVATRYRASKRETEEAKAKEIETRAKEIETDTVWVTASGEGDLLAVALDIPIRVVTIKQNDGYDAILDMLTFPQREKGTIEWRYLKEDEKPEEYIFIVDVGLHFIYAQPFMSEKSGGVLASPLNVPDTDPLIPQGSEEKIERFLELIIYNLPTFPESENIKVNLKKSLETLVSRPWTPIGHDICMQFDFDNPQTILKESRTQLLQKILKDRDGSFNDLILELMKSWKIGDLKNITSGLEGICKFYGSENRDRVLGLIEQFLQCPIYHPMIFDLLQKHFSPQQVSGATSTPKFDALSAQFTQIRDFQNKTHETLNALRQDNFGIFKNSRDEIHTEIVSLVQPSPAILYIYLKFLEELEDELLISLCDPSKKNKSEYIINVFIKNFGTHEKEIFTEWLENGKILKEVFESYCAVLQRLKSIAEDAEEIQSIFSQIVKIKEIYSSDKDWILQFPKNRIQTCLYTLSLRERKQIASALSLLNAEKYHIYSKEALSAFKRLLLEKTDNPEKELALVNDAYDIAVALEEYRTRGTKVEKQAFLDVQQAKYQANPKFLKKLRQVLNEDSKEDLKKRELWEIIISALFPEGHPSTSENLVHSFTWGIRQISPDIFPQLFGEDGNLVGTKGTNRHVVTPVHLPNFKGGTTLGHIKFFPDSPGIQYGARAISVLVKNPLPYSELLKFPSSTAGQNRDYPVSLSEHISDKSLESIWDNNEKIKFHPGFFSREFIRVLLTRDADGRPANYYLEEVEKSGTYRLVCIDVEAAFGDVVVNKGNKVELMHKSAVYCFDEMNDALDPEVREFILSLDIFNFVNSFITDVSNYNNRLSQSDKGSCFFDKPECEFWDNNKENHVVIPFSFLDEKLVKETIRVLSRLQELVNANPQITHVQLLKAIYPELTPFYVPELKKAISPKERLAQVLNKGGGEHCLLVHGSYVSTLNGTQVYLSHFGHLPISGELTKKEITSGIVAKDSMLSIENLVKIRKPIRADLEHGDVTDFTKSPNNIKQEILNGIPGSWPPLKLSTLTLATQRKIFQVMLKGGFHILDFSDCCDLTTDLLIDILKNNPLLKSLNLSRCNQLRIPKLLRVIADACPGLEILRLSGLNMLYLDYSGQLSHKKKLCNRNPINHPFIQQCLKTINFSIPLETPLLLQSSAASMWDLLWGGQMYIFKNLKHLYIDNCKELESACLVVPSLERLHARGCSSLSNLKMLTFKRATASLDGCNMLKNKEFLEDYIGLSCYPGVKLVSDVNEFSHPISIQLDNRYIRISVNENKLTYFNFNSLHYIASFLEPQRIVLNAIDINHNNNLLKIISKFIEDNETITFFSYNSAADKKP